LSCPMNAYGAFTLASYSMAEIPAAKNATASSHGNHFRLAIGVGLNLTAVHWASRFAPSICERA
jgi:hypothetical protein